MCFLTRVLQVARPGAALLALLALALPTRRALRTRPVKAIGIGE